MIMHFVRKHKLLEGHMEFAQFPDERIASSQIMLKVIRFLIEEIYLDRLARSGSLADQRATAPRSSEELTGSSLPQRAREGHMSKGSLAGKPLCATLARSGVICCCRALYRVHQRSAGEIDNVRFKFLARHAKHLVGLLAGASESVHRVPCNFSISNARPRCRRERTVPTVQPAIAAASA